MVLLLSGVVVVVVAGCVFSFLLDGWCFCCVISCIVVLLFSRLYRGSCRLRCVSWQVLFPNECVFLFWRAYGRPVTLIFIRRFHFKYLKTDLST